MISGMNSSPSTGLSLAAHCPACGGTLGSCACSGGTRGAGAATPESSSLHASSDQQHTELLSELQQTDAEVRAHEQAHIAAGGQHVVGGAHYTTVTGPDNRQYATGGEVSIDTSPVPGDPDATLEKARTVRQAALAPAAPSGQDMQVAAQAAQMEVQARMDKVQDKAAAPQTRYELQTEDFADHLERGAQDVPPRHAIQAYENASGEPSPRHGDFAALI